MNINGYRNVLGFFRFLPQNNEILFNLVFLVHTNFFFIFHQTKIKRQKVFGFLLICKRGKKSFIQFILFTEYFPSHNLSHFLLELLLM